jgi:hypothetical protein
VGTPDRKVSNHLFLNPPGAPIRGLSFLGVMMKRDYLQQKDFFTDDPSNDDGGELSPSGKELAIFHSSVFKRLAVKPTLHGLKIPKGLSLDNLFELANAIAQVEDTPQWWWGSFWHYSEFEHGERTSLTQRPDWFGPSYDNWQKQGAAYDLYCKVISSLPPENRARARLIPYSYFVRLLSLSDQTAIIELIERCQSGEIRNVRQLESEIAGIKKPSPALAQESERPPDGSSAELSKRRLLSDREAQV